jgi:hypothetical protein
MSRATYIGSCADEQAYSSLTRKWVETMFPSAILITRPRFYRTNNCGQYLILLRLNLMMKAILEKNLYIVKWFAKGVEEYALIVQPPYKNTLGNTIL